MDNGDNPHGQEHMELLVYQGMYIINCIPIKIDLCRFGAASKDAKVSISCDGHVTNNILIRYQSRILQELAMQVEVR